jgi:hypothetical protein
MNLLSHICRLEGGHSRYYAAWKAGIGLRSYKDGLWGVVGIAPLWLYMPPGRRA